MLLTAKDVIKLEMMRQRFTRMLPGLEGLSYKNKLDKLGVLSPEFRRLRCDLIEKDKIMRHIK